MTKEIYKYIPGYKNDYEVSNFGNVKSIRFNKEKILKSAQTGNGYLKVNLFKNGKSKSFKIHQLVLMAFLNYTPSGYSFVCDHINDIKTDNRLDNLQVITNRENCRKTQGRYSSQYKGVCWNKQHNKWRSEIMINYKKVHLGHYTDEYQAHLAYQKALHTHLTNDKPI
jgi:hypothetical protein